VFFLYKRLVGVLLSPLSHLFNPLGQKLPTRRVELSGDGFLNTAIHNLVADTLVSPSIATHIREVEVVREVLGAHESAMVIDKPLRSGQHIYAKGRDLIVMAMVNPGAEIMADGHIHVYAPLRGKAIAGARGDETARIFTSCLEAELISIAGTYRTSDTPLPKEVAGKAAQISLQGDKLVMQRL